MDDDINCIIYYHFEDSEQFWAEVEEILIQNENSQDSALHSFDIYIKLVSDFQDEYLDNEAEFMRCLYKLLGSTMFQSFSDKFIDRVIQRAIVKTDVKELLVLYNILFLAGQENKKVFKQITDGQGLKLISKLKDHIECKDGDRFQQISIKLLFEICCTKRLSNSELDLIDEAFLNYLLDLVEKTRDDEDETFNYSVIHLILSFNEQFMVSLLQSGCSDNTLIQVLGTRIGSSKTFGENVIFMLNRTVDNHIKMLLLKLLYEIFVTPETYEYFYTNDLQVLIDVFIRELYDLPEESEVIRQTYLRVLFPLCTNTQLCQHRYKQLQVYKLLKDLIGFSAKQIKPTSPVTEKLVGRCLMMDDYFDGIDNHIASPYNYGNGIKRVPTPNALVIEMNTAGNTNSSFTTDVVLGGITM